MSMFYQRIAQLQKVSLKISCYKCHLCCWLNLIVLILLPLLIYRAFFFLQILLKVLNSKKCENFRIRS